MSLAAFIPYLRTKMQAQGYVEHFDEFDGENIPATVLDRAFRITPDTLTTGPSRQTDFEWTFPVTVEIYFKGYNRPSDAIDGAFIEIEKLNDALFDISERQSQNGIRDIYPTSIAFERFSGDNDHIIRAKIGLTAVLNIYNSKDCL